MDGRIQRAADLLLNAERMLRDLVSEAAMSGDYTETVRITEWARSVRDLLNQQGTVTQPASAPRENRQTIRLKAATTAKAANSGLRTNYPHFLQGDDEVIRIAWSKRNKREYRHKAPHSVLTAVVRAMEQKGAGGRVFSTDDFLPLNDGETTDIPNYQAYVAIALLKHAGLIDQHGRQGYSIRQPHNFEKSVQAVWKNLPKQ